MLSKKFIHAIKTAGVPAYKIALQAGVPPWKLYKLMVGIVQAKPGDPDVGAIGMVLGLEENDLFEARETDMALEHTTGSIKS